MTNRADETWSTLCDEARGRLRCLIVDNDGNQVAEVNPQRQSWGADASLIAAAPAMFGIIRRLVNGGFVGQRELTTMLKRCREIVREIEINREDGKALAEPPTAPSE